MLVKENTHQPVETDVHNLDQYRAAALENVRISGYEPRFVIPRKHDDGETREDQSFERHVVIMEAVLNPHNRRLVHPVILNTNLCDDREILWRTGIPGAMYGELPSGKFTKWLLAYWWAKIRQRVTEFDTASTEEKEVFVWQMHDFFLCLQPFIRGNGRTARLVQHNLRQVLGMPRHIIQYGKAKEYYGHVNEYRVETFVPMMRCHGYIPS